MATTNKELMTQARGSLSGQWTLALGTVLIYNVINGIANQVVLIIGGPMQLGLSIFTLNISRNKKSDIEDLFEGFKYFGNSLVAFLLMMLYILLWALLLIIPGIIVAIAYAQTFYIMADDRKISGPDALRKSMAMMKGYKWKYFCLGLRFTGWFLLCLLTLGIGFLWLGPYYFVSTAKFYDDIKTK